MATIKPATVRLSSKGQLVIPRAIRESLHWGLGTELVILPSGNGVIIRRKRSKHHKRIDELHDCIKYQGPPIADEALQAPVNYRDDWHASENRSR